MKKIHYVLISIFGISSIILLFLLISFHQQNKVFDMETLTVVEKEEINESSDQLPPGWKIQKELKSKEYRWCDSEDFCSPFSYDSKSEAIESGWGQYKFRKKNDEASWKDCR